MRRRQFLETIGIGGAAMLADGATARATGSATEALAGKFPKYVEWLAARHNSALKPAHLDAFFQPPPNNQWARFDPELGYVPSDSIQRDGIDGSRSVYRYGPGGERKMINYADGVCRINTYGDSFTQCHQVSDGETWQEHLAAHLGEPIRNFGVGGYGVFQAFCRLRRMEATKYRAPYWIFNIYDDDHYRSVMPWRGFIINWSRSTEMFHANPWTHLRVNLDSGKWDEVSNLCPTPDALRALLSFDQFCDLMADNEIIQLRAMADGVADVPRQRIHKLADWAKATLDFTDADTRRKSATAVARTVSRRSTLYVLEALRQLARQQDRKLMVVFSFSSGAVGRACSGHAKDPADVALIDWLREREIPCTDAIDAHLADFRQFKIAPAAYVGRYYHGHYRPQGNQFFAFALKDAVVRWLAPKPIAYQPGGTIIDFRDGRYLEKRS